MKALYSLEFPAPFLGRFFRYEISQLWETIPIFKFLMPKGQREEGKTVVEFTPSQRPKERVFTLPSSLLAWESHRYPSSHPDITAGQGGRGSTLSAEALPEMVSCQEKSAVPSAGEERCSGAGHTTDPRPRKLWPSARQWYQQTWAGASACQAESTVCQTCSHRPSTLRDTVL